ncbi:MAG: PAS domain S-box protein, partial [Deltaproteobacteria bacterium]|nr:PAS domain S-box protein [Deltaproteobacteria bacterium]
MSTTEPRDRTYPERVLIAVNRILSEALSSNTEAELAKVCLKVTEELTSSAFGWVGELDSVGRLDTIALSDPGWGACRIEHSKATRMIQGMAMRGIWSRVFAENAAVVANEPGQHPHAVGLPTGHPPLKAFLGVPLQDDGVSFGILAVANKEGGYDDADRRALETLAPTIVSVLKRLRADHERLALRKRGEEHLLRIVEDRTAELAEERDRLQSSEKRYRQLIEAMVEGVWAIDAEGKTTFATARMAEMLGYTVDEMLGRSFFDFMEDELRLEAEKNLARRQQGIGEQHRFEFRKKDGSRLIASLETSPLQDDEGHYIGAMATVTDITEQLQLQAQLAQSDRMASIGLLAAGVAHEINNPLTFMLYNLETL